MASQLFRRMTVDALQANGQQLRWGHRMRGKAPTEARTLEQRLAEINYKDPEVHFRVDIGYKQPRIDRKTVMTRWMEELRRNKQDPNMEKSARKKELLIDLEKSKEDWWRLSGPSQVRTVADHYGIFQHLFGDAYFTPVIPLTIEYDLGEDTYCCVHRGNLMKPKEVVKEPTVQYDSKPDTLWTLLFTTPDGNFVDNEKELCHWFIGNIPGNEISKGDLLMDYMRPIPARGIGYCRYIFVLYKQEEWINYAGYKKEQPCLQLADRNWSTLDFYRKYQDFITPATLAFFQADWDSTLQEFYHKTLGVKVPSYEYDFPPPYIRPQEWYPRRRPFNLYLDKYRDPKEINKEFLLKQMKNVHPFRPPPPPLRFPNAIQHPKDQPSWLNLEIKKERLGWGRVNEIA